MSNHLTSLVYKLDLGSLLRKSVMILLADKASDDGSGIWASKQTMADELCCSKQAILNTLQQFSDEGLLAETGRNAHRNGYTVIYALKIAKIESLPRVKRWAENQSMELTGQPSVPVNGYGGTSQPGLPKPPFGTARSKKGKPSSRSRAKKLAYPLPDSWQPKELTPGSVCALIIAAWQPGRIERELSKFRDHHLRSDARWSDWDAAWRTWVQKAGDFESVGRTNSMGRNQPSTGIGSTGRAALDVFGT